MVNSLQVARDARAVYLVDANGVPYTAAGGSGGTVQNGSQQVILYTAAGTALLGQKTMAGSVPVVVASDQGGLALAAGETHVGAVGGEGTVVSVTPTVSVSPAYTANDNVGGKSTVAAAVRLAGGMSILQSVGVLDRSNQKAALSILLFDADPSNTTWTDNAQPTINATDISAVIRKIDIAATDYVTIDHAGTDFAVAEIAAPAKPVKSAATTSLWMVVITTGTPTYATTGALTFRLGFLYAN